MQKELETVIYCDDGEETPEEKEFSERIRGRQRPITINKHEQRNRQRSYRSSQSQNNTKSPYSQQSRPITPYNCYNENTSAKRIINQTRVNDLSCRSYSISDENSKWQTPLSPDNFTKEINSPNQNNDQENDQQFNCEQTLEC